MDHLTLSPLGDLHVRKPSSWAALADLTMIWPADPDDPAFRVKLLRASAAAIGLAVSDDRLSLPTYRPAQSLDLLGYGASVLDVLLPKRVQLTTIIRGGRLVSNWLASTLPSEQEVAEVVNFTDGAA